MIRTQNRKNNKSTSIDVDEISLCPSIDLLGRLSNYYTKCFGVNGHKEDNMLLLEESSNISTDIDSIKKVIAFSCHDSSIKSHCSSRLENARRNQNFNRNNTIQKKVRDSVENENSEKDEEGKDSPFKIVCSPLNNDTNNDRK